MMRMLDVLWVNVGMGDRMTSFGAKEWPPELLRALRDHLPVAIAEVVLRRAADQAGLGPEAWSTSIQRRKLIEALCARAAVFLRGEQVDAFRQALMEPTVARLRPPVQRVEFSVSSDDDVYEARQGTIQHAQKWAASGIARTRAATIVSELARNIHQYAGRGTISISLQQGCIHILAKDQGPGISNVDETMNGAQARGSGGLGLRGSKRLADTFEIESSAGHGTRITATVSL